MVLVESCAKVETFRLALAMMNEGVDGRKEDPLRRID